MYDTEVAWSQIIGSRQSQQDHAAIVSWPNGFRLLLLADGMGGHTSGDIASHCVLDTFRDHFINSDQADLRQRMIDSLDAANVTVYQMVKAQPELAGMGTTLVAVIYDGISIQWLSIGDSPMWLIRNGEIRRLNQNHSMAEVLAVRAANGEMALEEVAHSPKRSQLLEAVMGENIEMLDAPESATSLQQGDWLILASDGVETCTETEILGVAQRSLGNAENFVASLLSTVNEVGRPSQDNASLVVMHVSGADAQELVTVRPISGKLVEEPRTEN